MRTEYIQGAAFYLFVYLMLGLLNSGIMYAGVKWLHLTPSLILPFLIVTTLLVLYLGFKKSVEIFIDPNAKKSQILKALVLQLFLFLGISGGIEFLLSSHIKNVKLFQVLSVFINYLVFFSTYYLTVAMFVGKKPKTQIPYHV